MSDDQNSPKGVIAIVTNARGDVIAAHADFDQSGYGGFKLWQAQKMRAGKFAAWATIKAYASPALTESFDSYDLERCFEALVRKGGHKRVYKSVGWPADVAEDVES